MKKASKTLLAIAIIAIFAWVNGRQGNLFPKAVTGDAEALAADWIVDATFCMPQERAECRLVLAMGDGSSFKVTVHNYVYKPKTAPAPSAETLT